MPRFRSLAAMSAAVVAMALSMIPGVAAASDPLS